MPLRTVAGARTLAGTRTAATQRLNAETGTLTPTTVPRGIAISGLEFGSVSTQPTYNYFKGKGFNMIRLAFPWEKIQLLLGGTIDTSSLDGQIAMATNAGIKVVLDMHNFGRRIVYANGGFTENFTENPLANVIYPYADYSANGHIVFRDYGESYIGTVANGSKQLVSCNFKFNSRDHTFGGEGMGLRMLKTDANNYYEFYADLADNTWRVSKIKAGVQTDLITGIKTWGTSATYAVVMDVNQTTSGKINVKINGTALYTVNSVNTDNAFVSGQGSFWPAGVHVQVDTLVLNVNGDTSSGAAASHSVGDGTLTTAHFADFWTKIAAVYKNNSTIYGYDLMNEPHDMTVPTTTGNYNTTATVTLMMQAAITAVRTVDSSKWIFAELDSYAGGQSFVSQYGSNPTPWLTDSANKLVYDFHYYFNDNHDGTYPDPFKTSNNTAITTDLTTIMQWAQTNGLNLVCGEFGVPNDPTWQICLTTFFTLANQYNVWTMHWAAGDPYSSVTTLQPSFNPTVDKLQMAIVGAAQNLGVLK